jgi:hypothetical protein
MMTLCEPGSPRRLRNRKFVGSVEGHIKALESYANFWMQRLTNLTLQLRRVTTKQPPMRCIDFAQFQLRSTQLPRVSLVPGLFHDRTRFRLLPLTIQLGRIGSPRF